MACGTVIWTLPEHGMQGTMSIISERPAGHMSQGSGANKRLCNESHGIDLI